MNALLPAVQADEEGAYVLPVSDRAEHPSEFLRVWSAWDDEEVALFGYLGCTPVQWNLSAEAAQELAAMLMAAADELLLEL